MLAKFWTLADQPQSPYDVQFRSHAYFRQIFYKSKGEILVSVIHVINHIIIHRGGMSLGLVFWDYTPKPRNKVDFVQTTLVRNTSCCTHDCVQPPPPYLTPEAITLTISHSSILHYRGPGHIEATGHQLLTSHL